MKKLSKKSKIKRAKKVPFSKLSKPQKRVAIAKDVIAQIKIGRYVANVGAYIDSINFKNDLEMGEMKNKDIQKNFGKIENCTVCAMGACLMSATKFANKLNFRDIGGSTDDLDNKKVKDLFSKLFSPEQLLMIETAFEGEGESWNDESRVAYDLFNLNKGYFKGSDMLRASDSFGNGYEEDDEKLIAIMQNIIDNKGTFKP